MNKNQKFSRDQISRHFGEAFARATERKASMQETDTTTPTDAPERREPIIAEDESMWGVAIEVALWPDGAWSYGTVARIGRDSFDSGGIDVTLREPTRAQAIVAAVNAIASHYRTGNSGKTKPGRVLAMRLESLLETVKADQGNAPQAAVPEPGAGQDRFSVPETSNHPFEENSAENVAKNASNRNDNLSDNPNSGDQPAESRPMAKRETYTEEMPSDATGQGVFFKDLADSPETKELVAFAKKLLKIRQERKEALTESKAQEDKIQEELVGKLHAAGFTAFRYELKKVGTLEVVIKPRSEKVTVKINADVDLGDENGDGEE